MKKVIVLSLIFALALAACDALYSPTQAPALDPTPIPPTAEVIVVTVEVPVTVEPPAAPATPVPTATLPPAPTEAAPTEVPPTEAAPVDSAASGGPVSVDASLWGESFKDVTYSNPSFSLRCQPTQITFKATANDPAIIAVDFYFRMEDRKGTTITEWKNFGRMEPMGNANFSLTMLGETIHPDLRKALAWFDFQLVGINKLGQVVGRTEKIVQLVTYTIDCQ
jgi:hypothetical protein